MFKVNNYWYADFVFNGKRYKESLHVTQKSVAKELEQAFKVAVRSGEYQKRQAQKKHDIVFNDAIEDFISRVSKEQKSYKTVLSRKKHLISFFGKTPLSKITPDMVLDYKAQRQAEINKRAETLEKKEIVYSLINRELAMLRTVFNWHKKVKRLKLDNPVDGIEFYREVARTRVMTDEEEQRFFTIGQAPQHVKGIVMVALLTGMRLREILLLKKEDVILGDIGGTIVLRDTKNGDSRKVPLTKELTIFFKRIIDKVRPDIQYVFANPKTGKPMLDIKTSFKKTCKRAGIENLRFHDLRHTFCTRLANEGVNPFFIMQIVGHKDTSTAKRYCNPTDDNLMSAMTKLGKKSHDFSHYTPDMQNEPHEIIDKYNAISTG